MNFFFLILLITTNEKISVLSSYVCWQVNNICVCVYVCGGRCVQMDLYKEFCAYLNEEKEG